MNLLISLHSIFQDEESLGCKEEVEVVGLEEDLNATGLEDTSDGGGWDTEEEWHDEGEEGHEEGAGLYVEGGGVGVTGMLQDPHPLIDLGVATLFALL
jgi:hypothetical protein